LSNPQKPHHLFFNFFSTRTNTTPPHCFLPYSPTTPNPRPQNFGGTHTPVSPSPTPFVGDTHGFLCFFFFPMWTSSFRTPRGLVYLYAWFSLCHPTPATPPPPGGLLGFVFFVSRPPAPPFPLPPPFLCCFFGWGGVFVWWFFPPPGGPPLGPHAGFFVFLPQYHLGVGLVFLFFFFGVLQSFFPRGSFSWGSWFTPPPPNHPPPPCS